MPELAEALVEAVQREQRLASGDERRTRDAKSVWLV